MLFSSTRTMRACRKLRLSGDWDLLLNAEGEAR